ncbi:MAG: LysE family translocator [Cyanobacteria bacterium J06626_6]
MLLFAWFKGVLMGLAIAAPVGPIALLCIRRTLSQGRWIGLVSGCGAATADGLYGVVAAFGLSAVANRLISNTAYLKLGGGLFLCYLGLSTVFSKPLSTEASPADSAPPSAAVQQSDGTALPLLAAYSSTLTLTLTNPATILSFVAIFAGLGITQTDHISSVTLVIGVFTGSVLWWLVLVSGVAHLRNRLTPQRLSQFNQWSSKAFGLLILGFGIAALLA